MKSILLTLLFLLLLNPFVNGQERRMERMHDRLNLSQEQEEKIEKLRTEHQKEMIDLKAEKQKKVLELKELVQKDQINKNDYLAAVDKISEAKAKIAKRKAEHMYSVREILTPEQRKEWKGLVKEFGKEKHKKFSKGKGRRHHSAD